ncbi:YdgH/BhsA/McbA-like domain containing protein [Serratia marcescens]|uniref:YdgH/BhsA/McbA-like domain containing protein n=1 Tax=Serratia marcescens TaxID=615 RepID=UPI003F8182FA
MKLIPSIAAVLIAAASFSTFAAPLSSVKQVNSEQAANLQSVGVVSVSGISGSPLDAITALKEKAAADGASHYRIIGLDTPGDSSNWRGNAEIYR